MACETPVSVPHRSPYFAFAQRNALVAALPVGGSPPERELLTLWDAASSDAEFGCWIAGLFVATPGPRVDLLVGVPYDRRCPGQPAQCWPAPVVGNRPHRHGSPDEPGARLGQCLRATGDVDADALGDGHVCAQAGCRSSCVVVRYSDPRAGGMIDQRRVAGYRAPRRGGGRRPRWCSRLHEAALPPRALSAVGDLRHPRPHQPVVAGDGLRAGHGVHGRSRSRRHRRRPQLRAGRCHRHRHRSDGWTYIHASDSGASSTVRAAGDVDGDWAGQLVVGAPWNRTGPVESRRPCHLTWTCGSR